ncbi:MAG: hemerythrin domain-containing protein [Chloroflexi bacterium]|nr:hemerythrin domain-containing protein [Chloroflexota bacterium]
MAAPMNGFRYIHKAIRHELDALETLAGNAAGNDQGVSTLAQRLDFLSKVVELHAAGEDEVMYPALDSRVPQVTRAYALDHQFERNLFAEIGATLSQLSSGSAGTQGGELSHQLNRRLTALNATLSLHIWKEEEQLLPLLDEHFSVEEQGAMADRIVGHIPPEMMQPLLPWTLNALTADERADLMRTVMGALPAEPFRALSAGTKAHFPPADWAEIVRRVPELAAV